MTNPTAKDVTGLAGNDIFLLLHFRGSPADFARAIEIYRNQRCLTNITEKYMVSFIEDDENEDLGESIPMVGVMVTAAVNSGPVPFSVYAYFTALRIPKGSQVIVDCGWPSYVISPDLRAGITGILCYLERWGWIETAPVFKDDVITPELVVTMLERMFPTYAPTPIVHLSAEILNKISEEYFRYSDPLEGDIIPIDNKKRRGPTEKTKQRAKVFKALKDAHPEWDYDRVALEASEKYSWVGAISGETVRNAYRAMKWKFEKSDRIR